MAVGVPVLASARQAAKRTECSLSLSSPARSLTGRASCSAPQPNAPSARITGSRSPNSCENSKLTDASPETANPAVARARMARGNPAFCMTSNSERITSERQGALAGASGSQRAMANKLGSSGSKLSLSSSALTWLETSLRAAR
jgi:hypothetical protein